MKDMTGNSYQTSKYAKAMAASKAKVGKSFFLTGSALGLMPWQTYGGVVDRPSHLHVITYDANALGGVIGSMKKLLGAGEDALKFRIYNLQDDFNRTSDSKKEWDYSFYNGTMAAFDLIRSRARTEGGIHCVIVSSLTGLAQGIQRGIFGPPGGEGGNKKGMGGDRAKWPGLEMQLNEIRNAAQVDEWHLIWEAHIDDKPSGEGGQTTESIRVNGAAGRAWSYNVEQVFKIRRNFGQPFKGSKVDEVTFETRPTGDYIAGGRGFTELLKSEEPDMTEAFHKLGLEVGQWQPGKKVKKTA